MGKYELLYIVHPDLEASIDKILERIRSIIEKQKGKITYEENWGKRKLAYEIKKTDVGIYLLWYFEAPTEGLSKIERDIRLTEEIIRYIIIAKKEKVATAKPQKKVPQKTEEKEEKEKPAPKTPEKTVKKAKPVKKEEKLPTETEEERMKKLDEKLGALLGDDVEDKKNKAKVKKEKK